MEDPRGEEYEAEHVHEVYERIASHFSSTRYKPWPIVEKFLKGLPSGAVGVDVGSGNGKYLPVNRDVFILASDRSTNLIKFAARHQPHVALVADNLNIPHLPCTFDFALSIAVVHHLSTASRRIAAIKAVLELMRPPRTRESLVGLTDNGGRALFFVWALEQKESRRGWDETHEQDVMVPWVTKTTNPKETQTSEQSRDQSGTETHYRYYHLYRRGELEQDIAAAGGEVLDAGYEKDNWWAIATQRPAECEAVAVQASS